MASDDDIYAPQPHHKSGAPDWTPIRELWSEISEADPLCADPRETDDRFERVLSGFDEVRKAVPENHEQFAEKLKAAACFGLFGLIRQPVLMDRPHAALENEWLDLTCRPARAFLGCMRSYMLVPREQQMYGFDKQGCRRVRYLWKQAGSPWIVSLHRHAVDLRWV